MDCLEGMKQIDDKSVDMILCDLPYGVTGMNWDCLIPLEMLWKNYKRIIKPYCPIILTSTQPFTTILINSNFNWFKYSWIWIKSIPGDYLNAKNKPMRKHEDVLCFSLGNTANGSKNKIPYYPQGIIQIDRKSHTDTKFRAFFQPRPSHQQTFIQTHTN